jgi:hypothetical protein
MVAPEGDIQYGTCMSAGFLGNSDPCNVKFGNQYTQVGTQDCQLGGTILPGTQRVCKLTNPAGDPNNCCLWGSDYGNTCAAKYAGRWASGDCNQYYQTYCSSNWDNANSDICRNWFSRNTDSEKSIKKNLCATQWRDNECKDFCGNNPGECDGPVTNFCKDHPNDPFCSCLYPPSLKSGSDLAAQCVDKTCIESGYKTGTMINSSCPAITKISCTQINQIQNQGLLVGGGIQFSQNCGGSTQTSTGSGTNTTTTGANGKTTQSQVPYVPPPTVAPVNRGRRIFMIVLLALIFAVSAYLIMDAFDDEDTTGGYDAFSNDYYTDDDKLF